MRGAQKQERLVDVFRREFDATRSLESAVTAVATTVRAQIDLFAERTRIPREVKRLNALRKYEKLAASSVFAAAAAEFGVNPDDLVYRWTRRSTLHRHARWAAWAILRNPPFTMSLPEIAHVSRGTDHTLVLYGLRELKKRPDLLAAVARIEAALGRGEPRLAEAA